MKIAFIADFFSDQLSGGAENNDTVLIDYLKEFHNVDRLLSRALTIDKLKDYDFFIVSNFVLLSKECKDFIETREYIIYEHDHKYVTTRDPSKFVDFHIPKSEIVNKDFYINAKHVIVLSKICKDVIEKNLGLKNVVNIGTSLWSDKQLDVLETCLNNEKTHNLCIMRSQNKTKNQQKAEKWCKDKNKEYDLIADKDYDKFINKLSSYKTLVFLPAVLETFSRLVCEAKILNLQVATNKKLIGFSSEDHFHLKGKELLEETETRVNKALETFKDCIEQKKTINTSVSLNFVTYNELIKDTLGLINKIPKNKYDAIAPVLRSGSIPAFIISEKLNLPIFLDGKLFGGDRINSNKTIKNILLVDDSISSGRAMSQAMSELQDYNVDTLCIYSLNNNPGLNFYSKNIQLPRMFEWNMFNNLNLKHVMFDLDGVICIDPRVYDDDGINYENEIKDIPTLFLPKHKIHSICTNRISRWREITENWLEKNKVKYNHLIMQNFLTAVERRKKSNAGVYKAKHYANSNATLFVESSKWQAEKIYELTKKPVFCIENHVYYEYKKDRGDA